jgi:hypothetical protein
MAPGTVKAVWIKLTVAAGATSANPDGFIMRVTGDSLP